MNQGWKLMPLHDAFWFQEGPGVRTTQFTNSGIKLLNVGNITKEGALALNKTTKYISCEEATRKYLHFLADAGDLVIASSGISFDSDGLLRTRGAFVSACDLPLCLNTSTIRFKPLDGITDLGYLKHWLQSREFRTQITRFVTGSAQQNFGPSHLKATAISLPPLPEQRRIAAILDKAAALRAKRRQALATIDDLLPSAFDEMFESAKQESEFKPLHQLANIASGVAKGRRLNGRAVEANYLRVANVQAGYLDLNEIKTIEALPEEVENLRLIHGDVLLTEGGDFDKLGRGAMWTGGVEDCIHQNHVFRVRVDRHLLLPEYFHHFLQGPSARTYFLRCAKRTTNLASINMTQLKMLPTLVPSIARQREFVKLASASLTRRRAHELSAKRLDSLFASLQHRAFRGEL